MAHRPRTSLLTVPGGRLAGGSLLPAPTSRGPRRSDRPGRAPATWTDAELADARAIALRLITVTGRGKSTVTAALTLAGEGLPVPPATVLTAAHAHLSRLDRTIRTHLGLPTAAALDHRADRKAVASAVDAYLLANPGAERAVARRLRHIAPSDDGADAQTVLTVLLDGLLGLAPAADDAEALELILHALGLHGLAEPVGGMDGPRVLTGGLGDVARAIGRLGLPHLKELLGEILPEEVHPILDVTRQLGVALATVPATVAHHVAADELAGMLLDPSPTAVVLRLAGWQALRHDGGGEPDIAPIVDAVREQGWLPNRA